MPKIIKDKCVGCGICADICPEGIEIEEGKARIKNPNADCLKDAANACPRGAIILEDEQIESNNKEKDTSFGQGFTQGQGAGVSRGIGRGGGSGRGQGMGAGGGGGRGRMGGFAAGPGGECVCPACGYAEGHAETVTEKSER